LKTKYVSGKKTVKNLNYLENTLKKCTESKIKGFTMKSSCAPYKYCKKNKSNFLYNPDNPKKSFDVYINKNPSDIINIKYTIVNVM
jgi:hypothetical protein